jgi:hypothetical protein
MGVEGTLGSILTPSGGGGAFPQLPTTPDFTTQNYFEDFLYDVGGAVPNDISGTVAMAFGNPAGIDPLHPGVFWGDVTASSPAFIYNVLGNTQGFNLGLFATVNIEWVWQLNQNPGGTYQFSMGPQNNAGCFGTQGDLGILGNAPGGTCANMPNANLYLMSNNGADNFIDTGVTLASLFGTWVKCNILWSRSTGNVTAFVNGVLVATTATQIPTTLTDHKNMFAFLSTAGLVRNAGTRHLFDYIKLAYTMVR